MRPLLIVGVVGACIIGAVLLLTGGGEDAPRETPVAPVIVEKIAFSGEQARVEAVGTARARQSVMLFAAAAGEVSKVLFSPGDKVAKDAALVELDARRERLAVERAEVEVRNNRQLLARYERIKNTGAVSESQIDEVRTALDGSQVELKQAQVALHDRTVRAPFTGHVGLSELDPGDRVDTSTEIAPFDDRAVILVDFAVPEAFIGEVTPGTPITAEPWTTDAAPRKGEVQHVGSRIDPVDRSFTVRAAFDNEDDLLRPGMSFRMIIEISGRAYPFIPEASIIWGGEGSYLWAVREGKAVRVPAVIVERREGRVLVDAALREGETVVVEGVQRLRDGTPVDIVDRPAPAGATARQRPGAAP
ncbi:efflux RND transporter periplasmic adaptor subunit [Iodidimonas sp. SYSU 1G8]|uniref:efflux RND transporter periplasmic adaptor subunit n=1 Tax=Iodidimonas sp. SYSU 1G8 TaxID=3133967 RepID=UPI0031FE8F30